MSRCAAGHLALSKVADLHSRIVSRLTMTGSWSSPTVEAGRRVRLGYTSKWVPLCESDWNTSHHCWALQLSRRQSRAPQLPAPIPTRLRSRAPTRNRRRPYANRQAMLRSPIRLRLGPSIRTGRRPLRLADRERAETSLYQGRINDGNRTETPRAHARGARGRGGDRHRTASGRRRTVGRAAATAAWAVLRAGGRLAIQVRIARQRSAQRRSIGNQQPVLRATPVGGHRWRRGMVHRVPGTTGWWFMGCPRVSDWRGACAQRGCRGRLPTEMVSI